MSEARFRKNQNRYYNKNIYLNMPYTLSFEQQGPSWQLLFCMKLKPKSDASANS